MELKMFEFIEDTLKVYEKEYQSYLEVEQILYNHFQRLTENTEKSVTDIHTRIKSASSLQEKLLRNKFYLDYKPGRNAMDNMHDLIGITIECRFIRNEAEIYQQLFSKFQLTNDEFCQCLTNPNIYLNLHMFQPQVQRNGYTIYRLDGYYDYQGRKVNYELQIKSLVHRFWSEIEHEVVYKNPDFVTYDRFMRNMLGSVRDNLDVVDRQLEIISHEISSDVRSKQIGMDENGFKYLTATSINELINRKLKNAIGFAMDFKKSSSMLAQYIYIKDFLNGENNKTKMLDYLEHLNYLSEIRIDFRDEIRINKEIPHKNTFQKIIYDYFVNVMNEDFEWHVFFVILLLIQQGSPEKDISDFIHVFEKLLIQPQWYETKFSFLKEQQSHVLDVLREAFAKAMVMENTISMIHEDTMILETMAFKEKIEQFESQIRTYEEYVENEERFLLELTQSIHRVFHSR